MAAGEQGIAGIAGVILWGAFDDDDLGGLEQFRPAQPSGACGAAGADGGGIVAKADEFEVGGIADQAVFVGEMGISGAEESDLDRRVGGGGGCGGEGVGGDGGGGEAGEEAAAVDGRGCGGRLWHEGEYHDGKGDSKWILMTGVGCRRATCLRGPGAC